MDQGNRQHDRQRVSLVGVLRADGGAGGGVPCTIEDLSVGGARIAQQNVTFHAPARVVLEIGSFGAYSADVKWARPPHLGLKFHDSPEAMAEILTAIAMHG